MPSSFLLCACVLSFSLDRLDHTFFFPFSLQITEQTDQPGDKPGKPGCKPDAPYPDRTDHGKRFCKSDSSAHLHDAVDQRIHRVSRAIQKTSGNIDHAKREIKPACDAQCLCAEYDHFRLGTLYEELYDLMSEKLCHRKHQQRERAHDQIALAVSGSHTLDLSRAHILSGVG